jgi:hypothetical protein
MSLSEGEFVARYSNNFGILFHPQQFVDLFRMTRRGQAQLAFALAVAELDGSLGDALSVSDYATVPRKLRLVLETPELIDLIGENVVLVLNTTIGTLTSINMRNLVWHGFLLPTQFDPYACTRPRANRIACTRRSCS